MGGAGRKGKRRIVAEKAPKKYSTSTRTCVQITFKTPAYSLTQRYFYPYSAEMEQELASLEKKLDLVISLVENLRQQLAAAQSENAGLRQKMDGARDRLASLMQQIPEEE
jgi:hypothetical protein